MKIAVHLPDNGALPHLLGEEAWRHTFTRRIDVHGAARSHVVTFASLPEHIDVALQVIGESVRIQGAWATVNDQRMSSLVALWNRLDCYRQSLAVADARIFCASKAASLQAMSGCEAVLCMSPCQFLCRQCAQIGTHPVTGLVHPEAQLLAMLGEIGWCPNLRRPD
ncbi:MAG: hypothetical protein IT389_14465 [Nitrospira sp.]|nr:hypothetical protein [Nitrospira sp.]HRB17837.1 hypothetical protein [Nitrospira sp.]